LLVPGNATGATLAGTVFYRGYDVATDGMFTDMTHPATLSDFKLDRYEVTVGRFRKFVEAGMGTQANPPAISSGAHPHLSGSGWDSSWNTFLTTDKNALETALACDNDGTWVDPPQGFEDLPISCVNWWEAMAFCIWDGGYLPTETESMYAAAGGSEQRAYPWSPSSNPGDTTIACVDANYGACNTNSFMTNVGADSSTGDGRWGQADLGGNVWEWALDWNGGFTNPCNDCAQLSPATLRIVRGGAVGNTAMYLRNAYRYGDVPTDRNGVIGFRCARSP
jgi:formylglycine-generating enzyme required for sulfatase activity